MNKEDELLKNRIKDLADRSYNNNMFTFTDFLSLADLSLYYSIENELRFAHPMISGGTDDCERTIIRFGNPEQFGYEEDFPIKIICIKPLMAKFSDELSHRDILGALMNLGIERSVLGDIYLNNNIAFVFCLDSIADYICDNLTRVKHTSVMSTIITEIPQIHKPSLEEKIIQIQSARLDAVIAKVYNLSRSKCIPLFAEKKVFVNGRLNENNSYTLKDGDRVTLRGYGRFTFSGVGSISKKGKLNATILI